MFKKYTSAGLMAALLLGTLGGVGWGEERPAETRMAAWMSRMDPYIVEELQESGKTNIFILFSEQADLSDLNTQVYLDDKRATDARTAQAWAVYDALRTKANEIQGLDPATGAVTDGTVLAYLEDATNKSKYSDYRRFYIQNMIYIRGASRELIGDLLANRAWKLDPQKNILANKEELVMSPQGRNMNTLEIVNSMTDINGGIASNLLALGVDRIWRELKITGKGIVVATQDTGVSWEHPALKERYRGWDAKAKTAKHEYNWHDAVHVDDVGCPEEDGACQACGPDTQAPCDVGFHGTHTLGTVLGAEKGKKIVGMAPEAQWMACRNMYRGDVFSPILGAGINSVGTPQTYNECFEFFLAPYPKGGNPFVDGNPNYAPHVITNSWGCPAMEGCTDTRRGREFGWTLKALKAAGITVVVSAGNDGPACGTVMTAPAFYPNDTIVVGAYNHHLKEQPIASFSSRGPSLLGDLPILPHLAAPGIRIESAITLSDGTHIYYDGKDWGDKDDPEHGISGTSMAGPHVAGAAALLLQAKPELAGKPDQIRDLLTSSATPKTSEQSCAGYAGDKVPNTTWGYGILNVYKAISGKDIPSKD